MSIKQVHQRVLAFLVLVVGFVLLWAFVAQTITMVAGSFASSPVMRDYEELIVDTENRILIQTRVGGEWSVRRYRTLDGESVELSDDPTLNATRTARPYRTPGLFEWQFSWDQRIAGMTDYQAPPVYWVLMRDAKKPGRAYFVGYDSVSRFRVGFISRAGFQTDVPLEVDQFDLGNEPLQFNNNVVASNGHMARGGLSYNASTRTSEATSLIGEWKVFLIDGNSLQEVNLRDRTVRTLASFENPAGVVTVGLFRDMRSLDSPSDANAFDIENRLLVRCRDRLVLLNPSDDSQVEFEIPKGMELESFSVFVLGDERLALSQNDGYWERGTFVNLLTINAQGEVEREDSVQLQGHVPRDSPLITIGIATVVPIIFLWLLGMFVVAPLAQIQLLQTETYAEGVQVAWDTAWIGLILLLLLSLILTTIVYRWQQKYARPNTPLWTALVFLTTVPGFLAYWAMHRRPPLAACSHCGKEVPHNRDACARCAEPFPEPKLLGTEVFA